MDLFVHQKCAALQGQLRKLYRIRKYLTVDARKPLIQVLVISHLNYCSLLLGTKKANSDDLQHLQNSAARFILDIPQYENTKPYLQQLHWLPVQERIHFKNSHLCLQMPKLPGTEISLRIAPDLSVI